MDAVKFSKEEVALIRRAVMYYGHATRDADIKACEEILKHLPQGEGAYLIKESEV